MTIAAPRLTPAFVGLLVTAQTHPTTMGEVARLAQV